MEKVFVAHHLDDDHKVIKVLCYEPDCSEMHFVIEGESANVRIFDSDNVRRKQGPDEFPQKNSLDTYAALAATAVIFGMVLLVLFVAATIAIRIVR